jgi:YXWGXW repeat-containing protein
MKVTRLVHYLAFAVLLLAIPASSFAGVFVSVTVAPPVLPVYVQPACPGDGYIWTPGYWAYGPDGYYWVPGTWVLAPEPGLLWTPGYWGWGEGVYVWHPGYWGPHVGFYGGVNYGFGYFGVGFGGGYWRGRTFFYNRSVTNIHITNVHIYNQTVIHNNVNRVSYNGGAGGINARPRPEEERAFRDRRFEATSMQSQHEHAASSNRAFLASVNHGRPTIAASARPGEFNGRGVVAVREARGPYRPMDNHSMNRDVPRPQNSGRNMDRPMPHQDSHDNRGGQSYNAPRPENRGGSAPRPSAYHPEASANAHQHESAPRQEKGEDRGHGHGH